MLSLRPLLSCLALLTLAGCGREGVREWTPADHDQPPQAAGQPAGPRGQSPQTPSPADRQAAEAQLIDMAWFKQCASCHGAEGRGDGPQGPSVQAADLTRPAWQGTISDEQMAKSIREGKGKMPKFDLPPSVVDGLVRRIRSSRGR